MELKLEYIVAAAVGLLVCGSTAPHVLAPIEALVSEACKNISPKVRTPIEETVKRAYGGITSTIKEVKELFYPNRLLNQKDYR
jgi:hypothetical protein